MHNQQANPDGSPRLAAVAAHPPIGWWENHINASTVEQPPYLRQRAEMHNPQLYYHYKLMHIRILSEGRSL